MKFLEAETEIPTSPIAVWKVLVDGVSWPRWDSGVTNFQGEIRLGARIRLRVVAAPTRSFPVRLRAVDEPQLIEFVGGMPLGLHQGRPKYRLEATSATTTRFVLREEHSGPLLPLIWRNMPDLNPSFEQFATGLRAEAFSRNTDVGA